MAQGSAGSGPAGPHWKLYDERRGDDYDAGHFQRQLIGVSGLALPWVLLVLAAWRDTAGLTPGEILESVSAYYYTGAVAAFVGLLVALGLFLVAYKGYRNEYQRRDRVAATVAGVAAMLVAFFPTAAPGGLAEPSWWTPATRTLHYAGAVALFGSFAFFCLFLFPKSKKGGWRSMSPAKRGRNAFYYLCGAMILIAMAWAGLSARSGGSIFWAEVVALEFFALSWLVKGHTERTAVALAYRTYYYGRHPVEFGRAVKRAMRGRSEKPGPATA